MADRDQIIRFCDELLEISTFTDYGPNGLQVPGRGEVKRVATAVSAHKASIEAAINAEAELLITHHGLFWDFHPRALSEVMAERLRLALGSELNLAGYHLPLDAHPGIGNNVLLLQDLGFEPKGRFASVKGREIGFYGDLDPTAGPATIELAELTERLTSILGREPLHQGGGPGSIRRIGVVTGSAAGEIHNAIELGLDAFITGEPAEHVLADATEGSIHFFAAGHYATECAGVRRLGELAAAEFGLDHLFLDLPNPV